MRHSLSAQQIVDAAQVDLGTPLARLDLSSIESSVAAMPAVESVSVHRSWPHTVTIEVTERTPIAAIMRDGAWWVVDAARRRSSRRTPERDASLPVVQAGPRVGDDALAEAAQVISALPDDVLADVRRLTARSRDSIELRLKDHSLVRWGSADETDRKVQVLARSARPGEGIGLRRQRPRAAHDAAAEHRAQQEQLADLDAGVSPRNRTAPGLA